MKKLLLILGSIASINAFANGKISYGNGNFYFLSGDSRYFYKLSSNFSVKQKLQTAGSHENIQSTVYANNSIEAVGTDNPDHAFKVSNDLKETPSWLNHNLYDISYVNGKYTTVGDGIYSSLDGLDWKPEPSPNGTYKSIAYGNGRYVAVGDNYDSLIASKDQNGGWQRINAFADTGIGFKKVIFANSLFIAVGSQGTLIYSNDGISWKKASVDVYKQNGLNNVIYCPSTNTFVAVGQGMTIYSSHDGKSWNWIPLTDQIGTGGKAALLNITCNQNGRIVAIGEDRTIVSSDDGYHWRGHDLGSGRDTLQWVEHSTDNNSFLAGGENGLMYTSLDGENWNEIKTENVTDVTPTTTNKKPARISQTAVRFW